MDFDRIVIFGYFALILGVGLFVSKSVKNLDDFYTGNRNYGAAFIFATLSASFIGGGFTTGLAEKVFSIGLIYVVALWGFSLKEILVATIIAPRLKPFAHAVSVGDMMGQLYGKNAKVFTGFAGALVCAGIAGAQFSALGYVLNILTGIKPEYAILAGSAVVILYSALGGMKSVVINDVIHFCVLIIALPIVLLTGLKYTGGYEKLLQTVPAEHLSVWGSMPFLAVLGLFLNFFFGETLVPPYVQRLLIGKNFKETAKGTLWSGMLSIPFFLLIGFIGLIALSLNPSLDPHLALPYVIDTVMPKGLKGLAIAGMMAVVISSADSFLNAAAISLNHDVIKSCRQKPLSSKMELLWSRLITVVIGIIGCIFALSTKGALDILLAAYNFWTPFILVPLVAGILGAKASGRAFWWGAVAGIAATCLWISLMNEMVFNGAVVGILVNGLVFALIRNFENKAEAAGALPQDEV